MEEDSICYRSLQHSADIKSSNRNLLMGTSMGCIQDRWQKDHGNSGESLEDEGSRTKHPTLPQELEEGISKSHFSRRRAVDSGMFALTVGAECQIQQSIKLQVSQAVWNQYQEWAWKLSSTLRHSSDSDSPEYRAGRPCGRAGQYLPP